MSETPRQMLLDAIRHEIANSYKYAKRARVSDIAGFIIAEHQELVVDLTRALVEQQVKRIISHEMKSWSAAGQASKQMTIPGLEPDTIERLPPAISVPVEGNERDIDFIPAQNATKAEWLAHLKYLSVQHRAIGQTITAIERLLEEAPACLADECLIAHIRSRVSAARV